MSIPFSSIPGSIRLPGARYEINTGERPYQGRSRLLIIAPKLTGWATAGTPIPMPSNPVMAFGDGSIAAEMAILARRQASLFEIWMLPVADPTGTKAAATIKVDTVPVPGTYPFWVFGRLRSVTVTASDTPATLAAKISPAVTARWTLAGEAVSLAMPVTAAVTTDTVTVTARHNGPLTAGANWIDFELYGQRSALSSSVTVAYTVVGTGDLDMAASLAGLGDLDVDWIASVYDSSLCRTALENVLAERWGPLTQKYGIAVYATQGNYGGLAAIGAAQNTPRSITIGQKNSPDPAWAILAQCAADLAQYYDLGSALTEAQVLARPPSGRVLRDLNPPRSRYNAFTDAERNSLYFDGIAPLVVDASGKVTFELVPTMYQTDSAGLNDTNFLWINYPLIYIYAVRYFRNFVWNRHANTSIVGDDVPPRRGQSSVRSIRESHLMAYLKLRNDAGLVEDFEGFVQRLQVERSSDPVRVNVLLPIDAANPLHVLATNVQASAQFQS